MDKPSRIRFSFDATLYVPKHLSRVGVTAPISDKVPLSQAATRDALEKY